MDRPRPDDDKDFSAETEHMHVIDFLSYRLSMLSRVLDRTVEVARKRDIKTGLTEKRLLSCLCANPPTTLRAIAGSMCLDKAQISRAAAALVQMGMANRESDSADRRSVTFSATDEAADLYLDRSLLISRLPGWTGPILDLDQCQLKGNHNAENLLAALLVADLGLGHGAAHGRRRSRRGVTDQINAYGCWWRHGGAGHAA